MIKNKKLLIDADCSLCRLYGNAFEKFRFIDSETVTYYQTSAQEYCWKVNLERARSEIAFLDENNAATTYGIDALIEIVGNKFPKLQSVMNWKPVHFLLRKLYRFVSFNRKVIAGNHRHTEGFTCNPAVHKGYRWTYIFLTAIFTGFVLSKFGSRLYSAIGFHTPAYLEYAICMGQILWQGTAIQLSFPPKALDYLGNMSSVSLLGALLLIPVIFVADMLGLGAPYLLISFGMVVLIMIKSHISRCRSIGVPIGLTASWISYRLILLFVIIDLNFSV